VDNIREGCFETSFGIDNVLSLWAVLYAVTATVWASRELSAGLEASYELTRQNKNSIGIKPKILQTARSHTDTATTCKSLWQR